MWEKWKNGATRHDARNSSMHREAGQARSEHRTAVTQPEDPSLGADTQLTTGYIPSAKKRRIRRERERKRDGREYGQAKRAAILRPAERSMSDSCSAKDQQSDP